ncbi:MAG: hypothetical protein J6J42_11350 [Lachnospiraceae bacterium]|nr:hypothetical protein [Lachnospiraceae bacterium]
MGKFLMKMEQKYGKYALDNLPLLLVIFTGIGYVLQVTVPGMLEYLYLNPYQILHGQVWRLFTWVLVPYDSFGLFSVIILYCFYSIGSTLEYVMGKFRFNVYIFSGMLFTVIGSFVLYGIGMVQYADLMGMLGENGAEIVFTQRARSVAGGYVPLPGYWFQQISPYYIKLSMLLAFSAIYPDATVRINFLIPIKAKYIGILYAVMIAYSAWMGDTATRVIIVTSLLNFILFFFATRDYRRISPKEQRRKMEYRKKVQQAQRAGNTATHQGRTVITRHKCAICGRTELDDENLEFRFCSKCEGNFEYCSDHLYTHEHVRRIVPGKTEKPEE